jgi:hypothetical protein
MDEDERQPLSVDLTGVHSGPINEKVTPTTKQEPVHHPSVNVISNEMKINRAKSAPLYRLKENTAKVTFPDAKSLSRTKQDLLLQSPTYDFAVRPQTALPSKNGISKSTAAFKPLPNNPSIYVRTKKSSER